MQLLEELDAFALLCKATQKWGVFFSWVWFGKLENGEWGDLPYTRWFRELKGAVPGIDWDDDSTGQVMADRRGIALFDTEQECYDFYGGIVGDEGPTETNSYNGPLRAYAITCGPNGELGSENT